MASHLAKPRGLQMVFGWIHLCKWIKESKDCLPVLPLWQATIATPIWTKRITLDINGFLKLSC